MKFLISRKAPEEKKIKHLETKYNFSQQQLGSYNIINEKEASHITHNKLIAFIDGYIRSFNCETVNIKAQIETVLEFVSKQWPVNDSISGSFACTLIDEVNGEIILCNDAVGVYPLYYLVKKDDFFISNSLIWIGTVSGVEIDEVGLFQRAYCPEFANVGSRTLLRDTKRLLPGEWIKINQYGKIIEQKFDNELYQNISKNTTTEDYWNSFKKELAYCIGDEKNVHIALSGGMDSRLIIGGVPKKSKIFCHTYGKDDFYETKIAKRIATLYKAKFKNYSKPSMYIPKKEILEKHTLDSEAIYLNSWLEVLEDYDSEERDIMLLGDMTESLQGRNLPVKKNLKNFRKYYLQRKEYKLSENSEQNFSKWKSDVITRFTGLISQKHINRLSLTLSENVLRAEIINDLEDLTERVESHNLPYMELVTELFSWLTHSRIPMGKQILILDAKFRSFCVPMSVQILRLTSNLHPNLRVNGRFIKSLFTSSKELRSASGVPTSQIPFVSFNTPDIVKVPIWYLRSEIDDFLIKRLMKSGNLKRKYRFLNSFNWAEIYQHPELVINLNDAFKENYLGDYANSIVEGAKARRDLKKWPLSNINIVNAAALNIELGLLNELKVDKKLEN